ncbi:hypothetical protein OH76DRAFT_1489026 [Lentinus brumalis]|uniref:Uncharacterized protein n=1 Tax=Lentinus brumalis TaxID=2498619 RepID=A0A371CP30_9APHY|nr:hypothetical protein OH76DRAFT_1489026 [Polyporus brumalis]
MPKRKSGAYQSIKNLDNSARKKPRISDTSLEKELLPLTITAQQIIEQQACTFASIIQPTWSGHNSISGPPPHNAEKPPLPSGPEASCPEAAAPLPPLAPATPRPPRSNQELEPTLTKITHPPSIKDAQSAHADLSALLHPCRHNGKPGHMPFTAGDDCLYLRMTQMRMHLWLYVRPERGLPWMEAASQTSSAFEGSPALARRLRG